MTKPARNALFSRYSLVLLVVGAVGGVVFWGGFNTFMEYTNTYEFCTSCHEMETVNTEYKASVHAGNPSGVPAVCSDCHVPRPWTEKLLRKIAASRELYHKVVGTIDTPEKFEAERLHLARRVWASMEASDSRECRNCHSPKTMTTDNQSDMAKKWHERELLTGNQTCISCHKGIAHKLPDHVPLYDAALGALKAKNAIAAEMTAAAVEPATLYQEAKTDSMELATIDTGTSVKIVEVDGDMAKVSLNAWDREQSIILYEDASRPIQSAKLSIDGMDHISVGKTHIDDYTELEWREIVLEGWVSKAALTSEPDAVWAYAQEMFESDCGLCHKLPKADLFDTNEWPIRIKRMRRYTKLDLERQALVSRYVQRARFELGDGAAQ